MRAAPGQAMLMADSVGLGRLAASSGPAVMSRFLPHTSHSTFYVKGKQSTERLSLG